MWGNFSKTNRFINPTFSRLPMTLPIGPRFFELPNNFESTSQQTCLALGWCVCDCMCIVKKKGSWNLEKKHNTDKKVTSKRYTVIYRFLWMIILKRSLSNDQMTTKKDQRTHRYPTKSQESTSKFQGAMQQGESEGAKTWTENDSSPEAMETTPWRGYTTGQKDH